MSLNRGLIQQPSPSMAAAHVLPTHICFYSTKCEWSKAFIGELSKTPYKSEFRLVSVDPSPQRGPLPSWLKKVPTLVIAGEPEPRTDSDVMNWLYERKMKEGRSGFASTEGGGGGGGGGGVPGEPVSFTFGEMGGIYDDAFSSVDDSEMQPMGHNFSFLNGAAAPGTREGQQFQMQSSTQGDRRSNKEKMFDAQMEAYQRERNVGIPQMPKRM